MSLTENGFLKNARINLQKGSILFLNGLRKNDPRVHGVSLKGHPSTRAVRAFRRSLLESPSHPDTEDGKHDLV